MKVSRRQLSRHIAERLVAGDSRGQLIKALAAYMVDHRMLSQTELIVADIARYAAEHGIVRARVMTTTELSASLQAEVIAYVKRTEGAKEVEIEEIVEPSVLGGVIIETPSSRFDASIASQLKQLRVTE